MRKMMMAVAVSALTLTACTKVELDAPEVENQEQEQAVLTKPFTFHVKGDFSTSYDDGTRAELSSNTLQLTRAVVRLEENNSAGITDVWVLDYVNTGTDDEPQWTLKQQVHKTSSDSDFGSPSLNLTYGKHAIKLIASRGETPTLTATTNTQSSTDAPHSISWAKVRDTFVLDYPVEVSASSNGNRAPELKRAVAGLKVVMSDAVPSNAKSAKVTWQKSNALLLPSLDIATPADGSVTLDFPASFVGQTGKDFSVFSLASGSATTSVAIDILDANGTSISSVTIPDVQLEKNRRTQLTGRVFDRSNSLSIAVDAEWGEQINKEF